MAIAAADLINITNERFAESEPIDWYGVEINVKKYLSLEEEEIFINTCVSAAFDDSGAYSPNHCNFVMKLATLKMYTDVDIPEDIEIGNKIVRLTELYDMVTSVIDREQYEEIDDAIWKKINYSIRIRENEVSNKLNEMSDAVEKVTKLLEDSFGGIDKVAVDKLISSISDGKITEKGIADAVLKSINGKRNGKRRN